MSSTNCRATGKRKYLTPHEADRALKTLRRKHAPLKRVYLCDFCYTWHLTSKPDNRRIKLAA